MRFPPGLVVRLAGMVASNLGPSVWATGINSVDHAACR
jgi:hypothetical protein